MIWYLLSDVLSIIAISLSIVSLYFTWRRTKKEEPLLRHEVFSCKHKVDEDGKTTNLELVFRLHNTGNKGTRLLKIEVYATDFNGKEHRSSKDLSEYLDARHSTDKIRGFFYFLPPFQYHERMPCIFIVYHTNDEYLFKHESEESEGYLRGTHTGFFI